MAISVSPPPVGPMTRRLSPAQARAIDQFIRLCQTEMVAMARHLVEQYQIDPLDITPEGAVHEAVIRLCRAVAAGTIEEVRNRDDFLRAFHAMLGRFVQDKQKSQGAKKRGGSGRTAAGRRSVCRCVDADLNGIASDAAGPETPIVADDQVERLLGLLEGKDPYLRRIASLAMSDFTNEEIAEELDISLATVGRRLRRIRSLWESFDPRLRCRRSPHPGS